MRRNTSRPEVERGLPGLDGVGDQRLRKRLAAFEQWKERIVVSKDILGGEPVFPNSRLAVRHVGEMLRRGTDRAEILEDYPYLTERDLDFAGLYATAYPRIGRPCAQADLEPRSSLLV